MEGWIFPAARFFFKKVFSSFLFIWREGIDFADLQDKRVFKIIFMIVGIGRGNMVSCFFAEDLNIVGVFLQERDFRFRFFCSNSEFGYCSEFCNNKGVWEELFAITSKNPFDEAIVQGVLKVLVLHIII